MPRILNFLLGLMLRLLVAQVLRLLVSIILRLLVFLILRLLMLLILRLLMLTLRLFLPLVVLFLALLCDSDHGRLCSDCFILGSICCCRFVLVFPLDLRGRLGCRGDGPKFNLCDRFYLVFRVDLGDGDIGSLVPFAVRSEINLYSYGPADLVTVGASLNGSRATYSVL